MRQVCRDEQIVDAIVQMLCRRFRRIEGERVLVVSQGSAGAFHAVLDLANGEQLERHKR